MGSFGFLDRFITLAVAVALLWVARRAHRSRPKWMKFVGIFGAIIAGCCLIATIIGGWVRAHSGVMAGIAVIAFIICGGILFVDLLGDRTPDKPASFWAAFVIPLAIVAGLSQIPTVKGQIGDGVQQVSNSVGHSGGGSGTKPAVKRG